MVVVSLGQRFMLSMAVILPSLYCTVECSSSSSVPSLFILFVNYLLLISLLVNLVEAC